MAELFRSIALNDTPLLDVRAPVEYDKGTLPNAVNIPLLDNEQRHQVGLTYKNEGQQRAIELGEKLVSRNIRQERIQQWQAFATHNPDAYLFCFRGGLRSKTTQQWLSQAGVELPLIPGGYKAFRRYLIEQVEKLSTHFGFIMLGGRTGSGKTRLLESIRSNIDLEGMARHRGSSFGATTTPQPGNINFEHAIAVALLQLQSRGEQAIVLEDEGRMIGSVCIPEALRNKMTQSPIVLLEEPAHVRVRISREAYIDDLICSYHEHCQQVAPPTPGHSERSAERYNESALMAFADHHRNALEKITRRFGEERKSLARDLFDNALASYRKTLNTRVFDDYVELLLLKYYDPMYDYQIQKKKHRVVFQGNAKDVLQWYDAGNYLQHLQAL